MTSPSPDRRTAPLLVRLSPSERADLDRVRREMGLRSLAEAVRALPSVWDELVTTEITIRLQPTQEPQRAIRAVPQPEAHDMPRAPLVALMAQTTKAPAEAGAQE